MRSIASTSRGVVRSSLASRRDLPAPWYDAKHCGPSSTIASATRATCSESAQSRRTAFRNESRRCVEKFRLSRSVAWIAIRDEDDHTLPSPAQNDPVSVLDEAAPKLVSNRLPVSPFQLSNQPLMIFWVADEVPSPAHPNKVQFETLASILVSRNLEGIGRANVPPSIQIPVGDVGDIRCVKHLTEPVGAKASGTRGSYQPIPAFSPSGTLQPFARGTQSTNNDDWICRKFTR